MNLHSVLIRMGNYFKPDKKDNIGFDIESEADFIDIYKITNRYTMTGPDRMYLMYKSVEYICDNAIPGAIVESGVWKGGSMMIAAYTLVKKKIRNRELFLYDTYSGMVKPTNKDVGMDDPEKNRAIDTWNKYKRDDDSNDWCYASIDEVKNNMKQTQYPFNKMKFIAGDVLRTIPKIAPKSIAILRIDTDWYESTKHCLQSLYPYVSDGGVIILDDYGHWKGAKTAIDEFVSSLPTKPLLYRIDYSCRSWIKI